MAPVTRKTRRQETATSVEVPVKRDRRNRSAPKKDERASRVQNKVAKVNKVANNEGETNPSPLESTSDTSVNYVNDINGRIVDRYCWKCHKPGQDLICSSCHRVYHKYCLDATLKFNEGGQCPICQMVSIDGTPLRLTEDGKDMCNSLYRELKKLQVKEEVLKELPPNSEVVKPMDLYRISDKLIHADYDFQRLSVCVFGDLKQMEHNCCVMFPSHDKKILSARRLCKSMKLVLLDLEACMECFRRASLNDENFFVQVCTEDHQLVWAKMKSYPYWPAKCMKVINGMVDVRFFGTHDKYCLPAEKCYQLSKQYPLNKEPATAAYKQAKKELQHHITLWDKINGGYKYAQQKTLLIPPPAKGTRKSIKRGRHGRRGKRKSQADECDNVTSETDTADIENEVGIAVMEMATFGTVQNACTVHPSSRAQTSGAAPEAENEDFKSPIFLNFARANYDNDNSSENNVDSNESGSPAVSHVESSRDVGDMQDRKAALCEHQDPCTSTTTETNVENVEEEQEDEIEFVGISKGCCWYSRAADAMSKNGRLEKQHQQCREDMGEVLFEKILGEPLREQGIKDPQTFFKEMLHMKETIKQYEEIHKEDKRKLDVQETLLDKLMLKITNVIEPQLSAVSSVIAPQWSDMQSSPGDLPQGIKEVKCIVCSKLATISCCWNGAYCSPECQNAHLEEHSPTCGIRNPDIGAVASPVANLLAVPQSEVTPMDMEEGSAAESVVMPLDDGMSSFYEELDDTEKL